jgi:hypothetical protein
MLDKAWLTMLVMLFLGVVVTAAFELYISAEVFLSGIS